MMTTTFVKHTMIAAFAAAAAFTATPTMAHAAAPVPPSPVPKSSAKKAVTGTKSLNAGTSGALSATTCDGIGHNGTEWWANCRVQSGYSRAWSYCSDGSYRYGSWVGVGYWKFGGSCAPLELRDYGIQISD
jgi:hypothetical protein